MGQILYPSSFFALPLPIPLYNEDNKDDKDHTGVLFDSNGHRKEKKEDQEDDGWDYNSPLPPSPKKMML